MELQKVHILATTNIPRWGCVTSSGALANSGVPAHAGSIIGVTDGQMFAGRWGDATMMGLIFDQNWSWTGGGSVYLNGTVLSQTPPGIGFVQRIGWALTGQSIAVHIEGTGPPGPPGPPYIELFILSFTNAVGSSEIGSTVNTDLLSWTLNTTPVTQFLDHAIGFIPVGVTFYNDTGPWTTDQTWTLTCTDPVKTVTATTSLLFLPKLYWGPDASPTLATDAEVIALNSQLCSNFLTSKLITCAAEYIYFAFPTAFGVPNFNVNGLLNTAWVLVTRAFTNASGYTQSYDIYRSTNLLTGTYVVQLF